MDIKGLIRFNPWRPLSYDARKAFLKAIGKYQQQENFWGFKMTAKFMPDKTGFFINCCTITAKRLDLQFEKMFCKIK
jgi:hypothetical protein